ncbi:MAG: acetyl-CoA carboxylase, biotin carboxyl carrier protein [Flavobacteriales bacterium]|nr:acetyl-CoA carboxylase, biotin carboxyl carrier protein [Flavobacteriales bacterium]|tara:strand:- start:1127 stop:1636 length:510 start_codon:yes stop_codon:yes gene_type:complete
MDLKDIQELIKFVAKSGATEVDLEIDNVKISIKSPPKKKRGETDETVKIIQQIPQQITENISPTNAPVVEKIIEKKEETKNEIPVEENENYQTIKASMIGTFYRSSSPENDPFVNVGDTIKAGDTICIIEAMKLFNEIDSEISGKIIKVLVDDATPVEFDQPLFLIEPN